LFPRTKQRVLRTFIKARFVLANAIKKGVRYGGRVFYFPKNIFPKKGFFQ